MWRKTHEAFLQVCRTRSTIVPLTGLLADIGTSAASVTKDEGFSMRATARDFDEGLTLVRVDKPPKEEAVGCWVGPMGKA